MQSIDKKKRIMLDMSVSIIHHGHIRIIKKASKYGDVIIGLSSDEDIKKYKGYTPELNFSQRREIIKSIRYVKDVVKVNYHVTEDDLKKNKIDLLVHGNDYCVNLKKKKYLILSKTKNISSSIIRKKSYLIYLKKKGNLYL